MTSERSFDAIVAASNLKEFKILRVNFHHDFRWKSFENMQI